MRRVIPLILLAAGCAHGNKETAATSARAPKYEVTEAAPVMHAPAASAPAACRTDADCANNQLCMESRCAVIDATTTACDSISTHFDYDRATIRAEDLPALQRAARCAQARPDSKERIEGNCDERGTTEYNLALGEQRASAAKKYLVDLGVPGRRLDTVSYGKEKPRCTEETPECWATNRRNDFVKEQ